MHNWAKEIMEYVKTEVSSIGLKNIEMEHLCELEKWVCIADKIAEYDYYYHITEAMEKPENEYGVNYDENGRFYTPMRSANGRFKRGYDEMHDMSPMYYRDMDMNQGRMYYTEGGMNGTSNSSFSNGIGSNRPYSEGSHNVYSEGRYERARRGYEEAKEMNGSEHMEQLKEVFAELKKDMKELKPKMSPTELTYSRTELTNMANTMM